MSQIKDFFNANNSAIHQIEVFRGEKKESNPLDVDYLTNTYLRAFSVYKTGSGFRYQIFSQLAEKIPN